MEQARDARSGIAAGGGAFRHRPAGPGLSALVPNPYDGLPASAFWRRAVPDAPAGFDPVVAPRFRIGRGQRVAAIGSCFAQHVSRTLAAEGVAPLVTEPGPAERQFGIYPARFGNIYTPRQLLQLFQRAYGLFEPLEGAWQDAAGRFLDPFRPRVEPGGFPSLAALEEDRVRHLGAVRRMFEDCDALILTLGLTEGWRAAADGAAWPLPPGPAGAAVAGEAVFHNATVAEMGEDLRAFLTGLRLVNPGVPVLLTVSPVALVATYEPRHVLVSTTASKAALRVVAEEACRADPLVDYFPSFEIVTGPQARGAFWAPGLREVTAEGVAAVMAVFRRHYLGEATSARAVPAAQGAPARDAAAELATLGGVLCEEEALDR